MARGERVGRLRLGHDNGGDYPVLKIALGDSYNVIGLN